MKLASVSHAKNQLSALLEQVRQGETIVITDHDRPVAQITAITASASSAGNLDSLERKGLFRRAGAVAARSPIQSAPRKGRAPLPRSSTSGPRAVNFWDSSAILPRWSARRARRQSVPFTTPSRKSSPGGAHPPNASRARAAGTRRGARRRLCRGRDPPAGALGEQWHEVQPVEAVRRTAMRLLRVHNLRAADSLQLAAALTACEGNPASLPFVCLDQRLRLAAERRGFAFGHLTLAHHPCPVDHDLGQDPPRQGVLELVDVGLAIAPSTSR